MVAFTTLLGIGCIFSAVPLVCSQSYYGCHSRGGTVFCTVPDGKDIPVGSQVAPTQTQPPAVLAAASVAPQTTAVTGCHTHGTQTFCIAGDGQEVQVTATGTATAEPPSQYTGCHTHESEKFCIAPNGDEVQILLPSQTSTSAGGHGAMEPEHRENCHFHAGVEHCGSEGESELSEPPSCERKDRDYNIPLRIGSLFAILATSAIAVFGPMSWARLSNTGMNGLVFTVIKQFGTGVMVSTAFIHLMFSNPCLGTLTYEATTGSIAMAGIFLSFLVEYGGNRFLLTRKPDCNPHAYCDVEPRVESRVEPRRTTAKSIDGSDTERAAPTLTNLGHHHHSLARPDDKLSVVVMEAGIIFHSIIIGLTLVVAGDSSYTSLFIVIIFHQMFEGLALGARIAKLGSALTPTSVGMAAVFALITPVGMAVGLGVIRKFNGNDRSTLLAIGTLDALSAGILTWVALIDMWSHDWLYGDLHEAGIVKTGLGLLSLVAGMVLMGLLGKWA
ncbi:hypothetical protein I7I51_05867 [Histoplasma capsulatum]|uniref:Zinc/iron transporter n=1 Tax=Ajellomyces capsulatus TaxID=5037 RepID=A0A8A1M4U5_AJECA|nr:predicted protein [Histoplasma mississippiense (nom. inval.)]EDN05255.1 predicted protein [Histoplasma mississippiense (nom. inval.)]QSS61059.1 hypothetical protein I7I51_05867 [Histoplasma capsulatum]